MKRRTREPVATGFRALLYVFYAVPCLWIVVTSLKNVNQVLQPGIGPAVAFTPTLSAYQAAIDSPGLASGVAQSFIIASGTCVFVLVLAVPAAYALAKIRGPLPTVAIGGLIVLQMVPQTSTLIPFFQIFGRAHLLNNTFAVIIADTALLTPFTILLMRPFFRTVPKALEEAAAIDGASVWRTFVSVALPIARNGIITTATITFLLAWGEFLYAVTFFLTQGKYPLSALIAQQVGEFGVDWPSLMAIGVLVSLPVFLVFLLGYRYLKDGLTVGAVK